MNTRQRLTINIIGRYVSRGLRMVCHWLKSLLYQPAMRLVKNGDYEQYVKFQVPNNTTMWMNTRPRRSTYIIGRFVSRDLRMVCHWWKHLLYQPAMRLVKN